MSVLVSTVNKTIVQDFQLKSGPYLVFTKKKIILNFCKDLWGDLMIAV